MSENTAPIQELRPITFQPGCNTPAEVTRSQLMVNVERDLPWLELEPLKDKPLVIVAGGPSLKYYWPKIQSHGGDILVLNNAYNFLLDKGIEPEYFMLLDAREENVDFVKTPCSTTRHYIAAQCHPKVFDTLEGYDTRLFLTVMPESLELTSHINKPKHRIAGSVGTVGIKALPMAYALGYRELHLYGYDSSYEDGSHHAFAQKLNDDANTIEVYLDKKKYTTTPTLAHQVNEFCDLAVGMVKMGFEINLHCSGLLPDMVEFSNKEGEKPLEQREQEKYRAMWEHNNYRTIAPGERHVDFAKSLLGMKPGESIIDFGCGTGRAAQRFFDDGFKVIGIDFADNCRDNKSNGFTFVERCLWDLPDIKADYGFCTDVMEHIPTEKAEEVLKQISERCKSAYFNIATTGDSCGVMIGKKLHLTVMQGSEWKKIFKRYWGSVEMQEFENEVRFVVKHI